MSIPRGNAGFEYTHPTDSSTRYFFLDFPPEIGPGPEPEYGRTRRRREQKAWDHSSRTVWTASDTGVETARFRFRFISYPSDFMEVLSLAADGVTMDYYPDMDLQHSFALELQSNSRPIEVQPDPDRWWSMEYEIRSGWWSSDRLEELYL